MPYSTVLLRSRSWPRVAVLALIGVAVTGCSNSGRFGYSEPVAANTRPAPQQDVTGSISPRPAPSSRSHCS